MESPNRQLGTKIRIKSSITDLGNLTGKITEVKRGGWFMTDNPKISRPVRAREFDFIDNDDDDDGDDEEDNNGGDDKKDPFFAVGTTIRITSGDHVGRICNISERRCGIFLKIKAPDSSEERYLQPEEVEVLKFPDKQPADDEKKKEEEEEKQSDADTASDKEKKKKKKKSFGHEKYIGATVSLSPRVESFYHYRRSTHK